MSETVPMSTSRLPARLRRLKPSERVRHGDFVQDENQELMPWQGPGGFRADAFVNQIYRPFATVKARKYEHIETNHLGIHPHAQKPLVTAHNCLGRRQATTTP